MVPRAYFLSGDQHLNRTPPAGLCDCNGEPVACPRVSPGAPARQTPGLANHWLKLSSLTGLQIHVCSVDSTPILSSTRNLLAPIPCCLHQGVEVGEDK